MMSSKIGMVVVTILLVQILYSLLVLDSRFHLSCLLFPLLLLLDMIRGLKVEVAWACFLQVASMDMDLCRYVDAVCFIFLYHNCHQSFHHHYNLSLSLFFASNDKVFKIIYFSQSVNSRDSFGAHLGV